MKIITHNGSFHSDDVFAVATLFLKFGKDHELIRTRDPEIIKSADIAVDVGHEYDESRLRFDHHQGPPLRPDGIPYASFGLVWKKYGAEIAGSSDAAVIIEHELVRPIDAADNSIDVVVPAIEGLFPYLIQDVVKALRPTWQEDADFDAGFMQAVGIADTVLRREIMHARAKLEAQAKLQSFYDAAADKRMLILDRHYPKDDFLFAHPDVLFVIFPNDTGEPSWIVRTVAAKEGAFESRKDLPESWAGLRDADLAKVTGVPDAVFCHRARFLAVAKTREGAIKLAELALTA